MQLRYYIRHTFVRRHGCDDSRLVELQTLSLHRLDNAPTFLLIRPLWRNVQRKVRRTFILAETHAIILTALVDPKEDQKRRRGSRVIRPQRVVLGPVEDVDGDERLDVPVRDIGEFSGRAHERREFVQEEEAGAWVSDCGGEEGRVGAEERETV